MKMFLCKKRRLLYEIFSKENFISLPNADSELKEKENSWQKKN